MNQEKIKEQAKKIMDEFMAALEQAPESKDFGEKREKNIREKKSKEDFPKFKEQMFINAPKKNEDFILAEKKKW